MKILYLACDLFVITNELVKLDEEYLNKDRT
jgi:hypothetical protein